MRLAIFVLATLACGAGSAQTLTSSPARQQNPPHVATATEPQQDSEIEVVETNLTTILMTATDKRGRLLNTLKPEDVRIFEDGVPQTLGVFERETERPLSLALLFDVSVSQMRTLPAQKAAARLFLRSVFRPGVDRATVISFAGNAILQQPFTSDLAPLEAAVESVGIASRPTGGAGTQTNASPILPFGGTAIYDALFLTCFKVLTKAAPNTRRAVILLSDGMDNESRLLPRDAVNGAAYANATIYGIGIGTYTVDEQALRYVSEESGGRAFFPTDESDLRAAFAQIERELRSQYLIAYTPTNKAHDGMRRNVRIEITNPLLVKDKVKLAYRSYYYVKKSAKAL